MTDTQLPDDLAEQLAVLRESHGEAIESSVWCEQMHTLARKYAPKPETLADHAAVLWTRAVGLPHGDGNHMEVEQPRGVCIDNLDPVPWPEIEGINPTHLLNDGWQIHKLGDVNPDKGWDVVGQDQAGNLYPMRVPNTSEILVFCRPPRGDK